MAAVNKYKSVLNKADFAKEQFDGVIARSQRMLLDGAITLIKELETDEKGYIKQSIANMRRIAQIKSRLHKIAENKEYQRGIRSLLTTFDSIYDQSKAYYDDEFRHKSIGARTADRALVVKQLAADNTIEGLAGAGLKSNVTDKLADIITRSVTTGARYADLVKDMHTHLEGDGGLLSRYAKTYTTTAMSQYVGQVNKMMTDGIDAEWFMYIGSNIETTREFCQHLSKKKWVHVSEIPEILKGHIDGYECHIYEKTGLPDGMIEGTTEENFQVNVGGWNCGHALVPVSALAVPEDIRRKFDAAMIQQKEEEERQKAEQERRIASTKRIADGYIQDFKGVKGVDTSALEDAYKSENWDAVRAESLKLALIKRSMLQKSIAAVKEAMEYGEIDASKLKSFYDERNIPKMHAELKKVEKLIDQTKAAEKAISDLIPNAHTLHKTYAMADLETAHKELEGVMNKWLSKYSYSSIDSAPLQHLKNKLEFEIQRPTFKYSDSNIVNKAIQEKIRLVDKQIKWNELVDKANTLKDFTTKSSIYKSALKKISDAIKNNDAEALTDAISDAEEKQRELIEKQIKRGGSIKTALNKEYKGEVVGKDLTKSFDTRKIIANDQYEGQARYTNDIARMQGFDSPAKLVSSSEFDKLKSICGDIFYRTLSPTYFNGKNMTSKEFASQLYLADRMDMNGGGGRCYGDGIYVASSSWDGWNINPISEISRRRAHDESYRYGKNNPTILEMTFTRPPKIIKQEDLYDMWMKLTPQQRSKFGYHENTYACALGYDAMYCEGVKYIVVWNRSILAINNK